MKLYNLQRKQIIPRRRKEVFAFFSKPENLSLLTPPSLEFNILTPVPVQMNEGALVDYTIKVAGLPVRWTTLITLFDAPTIFVDVQLKGPYSFWHHTHEFADVDRGTEMTDSVRYGMPAGCLGSIVHTLFVKPQLRRIFEYREKRLKEIFPDEGTVALSAGKEHKKRKKT